MKVAVIGGTGRTGSQVGRILDASGRGAVPYSPSAGVGLLTGRGLSGALKGAGVVASLASSPAFGGASPALFQAAMGSLLAAASAAGAGHAVILPVVDAGQVPGLVCDRAKVLQEDILKAGPVPYSIARTSPGRVRAGWRGRVSAGYVAGFRPAQRGGGTS